MRSIGLDVRILITVSDDNSMASRLRWLNSSELLMGWDLSLICTKDKTIIKVTLLNINKINNNRVIF